MKILILDDDQIRHDFFNRALFGENITNVYTADQCIDVLRNEKFDIAFLDHDLGGQVMVGSGPKTGYQVACFLEMTPHLKPPRVIIHSLNPSGARNMQVAIKGSECINIFELMNGAIYKII